MTFLPVDRKLFNQSLIHCTGIITGGGFETPAEALHLGKKIISIPIRGQYEQQCNAAALEKLGVWRLDEMNDQFPMHFEKWMNEAKPVHLKYAHSTEMIVENLFSLVAA